MQAYYNEMDPYAAAWLRNLVADGLIPAGDVDERSIVDVSSGDLIGYTQCHFFAGIGGWAYAARLAGWADDRPLWTGSCPCQPFSVAGEQRGFADDRHLWPQFRRLIEKQRPPVVFGEQVAGASDWLRLVRGDLVALGYAVGAIPLEAASAGAEHYRDRYWFVADYDGGGGLQREQASEAARYWRSAIADDCPVHRAVANSDRQRLEESCGQPGNASAEQPPHQGAHLRHVDHDPNLGWGEAWTEREFRSRGFTAAVADIDGRHYVECPEGKWRRLPPPRVRWLGNGIPARVAKLRAFGNAIDPRPAAQFIAAFMDALANH